MKNSFKEIYSIGQKINVKVGKVSDRGIELKIENE
jgi:hypothetical protein